MSIVSRTGMFALAAVTALAFAGLSVTDASAKPNWGGGGGNWGGGGGKWGGGKWGGGGNWGGGGKWGGGWGGGKWGGGWGGGWGCGKWGCGNHWGHHHWRWRRHFYYAAPAIATGYVGYRAAQPNLCTCLTKEYTPEGQVVFKDRCTNEMAMAPVPGVQQQGAAPSPQNFAGRTFQDFQNAQQGQPQR